MAQPSPNLAKAAALLLFVGLLTSAAYGQEALQVYLPGSVSMEFIWVDAGSFQMGTSKEQEDRMRAMGVWSDGLGVELPAHQVTISQGFYLGKYEVTQPQWEAVMGTKPWDGFVDNRPDQLHPNAPYPAAKISWDAAHQFVKSMNEMSATSLYRLPTEAEWEYACRAGTSTFWYSGDDPAVLSDYAWYHSFTHTSDLLPVGSRLPNAWGFHDMLGNVWEWCEDWAYREYSATPQVDPLGPKSGIGPIVRGGNMKSDPWWGVRSAFRGSFPLAVTLADDTNGFRVVCAGPKVTVNQQDSWGKLKLLIAQ